MIIDGGSNDKTKDIVAEYQKSHQNIRFIENKKKIQSVAFNIGFKKSTAPYIIRLDAHAEYDSQYIALCLENLKKIALGAM